MADSTALNIDVNGGLPTKIWCEVPPKFHAKPFKHYAKKKYKKKKTEKSAAPQIHIRP